MKISYECSDLIQEIQSDILEFGKYKKALSIYELKTANNIILKALVSYDLNPEDLDILKDEAVYKNCIFEENTLYEILQIAIEQNSIT